MKRRLRTFAIFAPDVRVGRRIADRTMRAIYAKLIARGFVETPWQYVFDGQIGGVVLPHTTAGRTGHDEIHVRFYADRIFTEFEIGRARLSHFYGPRLNANTQLLEMLAADLDSDERTYLVTMTEPAKLLDDELAMPEWKGEDCFHSFEPAVGSGMASSLRRLLLRVEWRPLAGLSAVLSVLVLGIDAVTVTCAAGVGALTIFILPSKGRP